MPTVIDTFLIEIGLDPKKLSQGQREAVQSFKKTQDESLKYAKGIEASGERAAQFFSRLRTQAIALFAVLLGGRGIKDFTAYVTQSDAAAGRFSRGIGQAVAGVTKWAKAVELAGGESQEAFTSFQRYSDAIQNFQAGRGDVDFIAMLDRLANEGGRVIDKTKPIADQMLAISENLRKVSEKSGPTRANWFGRQLGLEPGVVNVMLRDINNFLALAEKVGPVTDKNTQAAERLLENYRSMILAAEGFGRAILYEIEPALSLILKTTSKIFQWWQQPSSLKSMGQAFGAPLTIFRALFGAKKTSDTALPIKPGATAGGSSSVGLMALAASLRSEIPELKQFTALNDIYHQLLGRGGHPKGLALDFTLNDPKKSADVAARIRAKLASLGVDARVIDEYLNPSRGSTGGHIHVGFANAAAASRYQDIAATNYNNSNSRVSSVTVGTINVHTQATDADGILRDIKSRIEQSFNAILGNSGSQ